MTMSGRRCWAQSVHSPLRKDATSDEPKDCHHPRACWPTWTIGRVKAPSSPATAVLIVPSAAGAEVAGRSRRATLVGARRRADLQASAEQRAAGAAVDGPAQHRDAGAGAPLPAAQAQRVAARARAALHAPADAERAGPVGGQAPAAAVDAQLAGARGGGGGQAQGDGLPRAGPTGLAARGAARPHATVPARARARR